MIPQQLMKKEIDFILLKQKAKSPIGNEWIICKYDDDRLKQHIKKGNNYGVVANNGLIIIDADSVQVQKHLIKNMLKTFTVKSGKGIHFYYFCKELTENIKLYNKLNSNDDPGQIQVNKKYCVAPNSVHPNGSTYEVLLDEPIKTISKKELMFILTDWLKPEPAFVQGNSNINADLINIPVTSVIDTSALKHYGNRLQGPHPIHGSESGTNFVVWSDGLATCFRHDNVTAGGLYWLAVAEGIINCGDKLMGEAFIKTLKIAEEKGLHSHGPKREIKHAKPVLKFAYRTDHLPFFNDLKKGINLIGEEYLPLIKNRYYQLVGMVLQNKIIKVKSFYLDTRVHSLYALKSGQGKRNFKHAGVEVTRLLNMVSECPTSLHPEQLVGKIIERGKGKNKEYIQNKGFFDSDLLQHDESLQLMTSNEKSIQETRGYVCQATDPFGRNEINKKLVDHFSGDRICYCPRTSISLFFQPEMIPSTVVTTGFLRRFNVLTIINETNIKEVISERFKHQDQSEDSLKKFRDFLDSIKMNEPIKFSNESIKVLQEYSLAIIDYGFAYSNRGYYYTQIMKNTLPELLIKFSALLAYANRQPEVTIAHVKLAFMDLIEFYDSTLLFVDRYVKGRIDYGDEWGTSSEKVAIILEWLYNQGAVSEEASKVSIKKLQEKIMEVFNITERGARYNYNKMVKGNLLEGIQTGQHDSKVWLLKEPERPKKFQGVKGDSRYQEVNSEYKTLLGGLSPSAPSILGGVLE